MGDFLASSLNDFAIGIVVAILGALIGRALFWFRRQQTSRRLWPIDSFDKLKVIPALSTETDTGVYVRPATGIGQVRALAEIAPTLTRRDKASLSARIDIAPDQKAHSHQIKGDLILLGGPKNNSVVREILRQLKKDYPDFPVAQVKSEISWSESQELRELFDGEVEEGEVTNDFGYVIRCRNPFQADSMVLIFAGGHTYGTVAAASWYVSNFRHIRVNRRQGQEFVALVECRVRNHEIFGEIIQRKSWRFE